MVGRRFKSELHLLAVISERSAPLAVDGSPADFLTHQLEAYNVILKRR